MIRWNLFAALIFAATAVAQDDVAWEKLSRVPNRFDPVKDDLGFYWQLTGAGSFYTMGANVYQSANQLSVNGAQFAANAAYRLDETRYAFEGEWPEVKVRRDVWLDTTRSAVRHLELISNRTDRVLRLPVEVRTDFSHVWQDIFSNTGKVLADRLGARDAGMLLKFNPVDGTSDLFYLFGDDRGEVRPNIQGGNSNRQIVLQYNLTIPPGETVALLYWTGQRTVTDIAETPVIFEELYQRRGPVRPLLPVDLADGQVVNFEISSPPAPEADAFDPSVLVGVNRLLERMEVSRSGEDLLWMSFENQLSGTVQAAQPLVFQSRFGQIQVDWSEIAALRGGAGLGRYHEVLTRDGERLVGTMSISGVRMGGEDGWEMTLEADSLDALLLRVTAEDGRLAGGVWGFAELKTGEILGLRSVEDAGLAFATPWRTIQVPLDEIQELIPVSLPSPRQQLVLSDGSRLTGFVVGGEALNLENPRFGRMNLDAGELRAIWRKDRAASAGTADSGPDFDLDWLSGGQVSTIWLEGRNRLPGTLAEGALHLISGSTVTAFEPGDVASIRRTEDGILDRLPLFEVHLRNGESMSGRLRESAIRFEARGETWEAPTLHFLGFRSPEP